MLAIEQALAIAEAQETWSTQDDLCDCTFQRIGNWFNPYIGAVEQKRICCIDAELRKMFPQFFRTVTQEPAEWNGETDMPASIWHRQLANHLNVSVAEARTLGLTPPPGTPRLARPTFYLKWGNEFVPMELGR